MTKLKLNRAEPIWYWQRQPSPCSNWLLVFNDQGCRALLPTGPNEYWPDALKPLAARGLLAPWPWAHSAYSDALGRYFAGQLDAMSGLSGPEEGSAFQLQVWQAIRHIPAGQSQTYGQLAQQIGNPKAVRALGRACGANPRLLITPCHRVLAKVAAGRLNFSAGPELKAWLLAHEGIQG